jgi:hypothetical protein
MYLTGNRPRQEKYGSEAADIFTEVVAVFQALPLAATLRELDGSGFVVLHGGLPGEHSQHQRLAQIAEIDRSAPGLDVVCGDMEDATAERATVSDILWSDPDPDTTASGRCDSSAIDGSTRYIYGFLNCGRMNCKWMSGIKFNRARGGGMLYSAEHAGEWLAREGLHTLIRSHQMMWNGAEQVD